MKWVIIFLVLMAMVLRGMAQFNSPPQHFPGSPDIVVGVNLSDPTNWPPSSQDIWGNGAYFHYALRNSGIVTNEFGFTIYSPVSAQEAWLLKMETNGSFSTITNLILSGGPDLYYASQSLILNTNDIQGLLRGDWYVEINLCNTNYFGNLTVLGWQGPFIGLPLERGVHSFLGFYALSGNNRSAKVVFDGSHCTDYFYLPVQCMWTMQPFGSPAPFTVTNLMTTNRFSIGWNTATIQVTDGVETSASWDFQFNVITAADAVQIMINGIINGTPMQGVTPRNRRIMIKILTIAREQSKHGQMAEGCAQLQTFKQFVNALHLDSYTRSLLLSSARQIIDAVKDP